MEKEKLVSKIIWKQVVEERCAESLYGTYITATMFGVRNENFLCADKKKKEKC